MNKQDQAYEVGDRPAQEIEITPEMIEAGVETYRDFAEFRAETLVEEILRSSLAVLKADRLQKRRYETECRQQPR